MFDLFFINFGIHSTAKEIFYYYKDGDIISVYDYSQSLLYFGNINKKDNYYNIKYIFDFKNQNFLYKELDIIKKIGIENYINNYAVFSDKNDKDYISPIFSSSNIIGYCYKYNPDIDYDICFNYNDYFNNNKLYKISKLYFNYYTILKKMNRTSNYYFYKEKYYLINKYYLS